MLSPTVAHERLRCQIEFNTYRLTAFSVRVYCYWQMREPLTLPQVKRVLESASQNPIDPNLAEMIPRDLLNYIQSAPDVIAHLSHLEVTIGKREKDFQDLNLALVDYANQSGAGQMMLDNLKLCLDQVRMRR
jgi:hypothetical protein